MNNPHLEYFEQITRFFCTKLDASFIEIMGGSKQADIVTARILSIYFCKKLYPFYVNRIFASYFKISQTMVSTINTRIEGLKYSDKVVYLKLPEYESEIRKICPVINGEDKAYYCKKLAEIDYSLLVIEKYDINLAIVKYATYTAPKLRSILEKRLLDAAQAELYRDYNEPLNRK